MPPDSAKCPLGKGERLPWVGGGQLLSSGKPGLLSNMEVASQRAVGLHVARVPSGGWSRYSELKAQDLCTKSVGTGMTPTWSL